MFVLSNLHSRGCGKGKWYKFNDTVIEEFDLNDETLEYECFGGEYRPKVYDQSKFLQMYIFHWFYFLLGSYFIFIGTLLSNWKQYFLYKNRTNVIYLFFLLTAALAI